MNFNACLLVHVVSLSICLYDKYVVIVVIIHFTVVYLVLHSLSTSTSMRDCSAVSACHQFYILICYPEKSTEVDLTSDTLKLASGNLDTFGCLGVSNCPAVDFRVDYRLHAFSSS